MQWRDHVQEIKQMKVNESKARGVLARARMRAVARAFNRWVFFIDERRRVMDAAHMVILRVKQRHLAYAFDGWLDAVHKKKRNRLLVANSLRKMRYRITVRAFYSWIESVDEARASRAYERRIERAVKMSLTKVLNRTLSRAFNAWNYKMIEQKRHRTLVSKSLHRARNKTLAQAFDGWSTHVLMIRRQKELVSTSLQRMRRRALVKAFNSWSGYMKQIRSFRVVERRLQNVERAIAPLHVTHSSVSDMVRVNVAMRWGLARNERIYRNPMFMAWVRYSQRISEHRNRTVKKMHDILADRARRKFLRSWRQFTEVMKYHRLKTEHRQKRVVRKIFSEWKMNARSPSGAQETYSLTKYERPTISTGWDFDKSYEENIRLLGRNRVASKEFAYGSRYSTPTASPRTMPTVVEPDSYEKQYRAVMSDVQTMEAEVEALSTVRESLQDQFDLLARDEALRATFARATSASVSLLEQTKSTHYSDRRFSEPFSPVKVSRQPPR
jgi:protein SFI1